MPPRRRLPEQSSSRERVLAAATDEFAGHGFAGARIDRIARKMKLNVRMIYYHFGNKKGLYRAVLKEIYTQFSNMIARALEVPDPERRTIAAMSLYFDLLAAQPHFADVLIRELLDGGDHLRALFVDEPHLYDIVHKPAFALVAHATKAGEFRDIPSAETVVAVTATMLTLLATRNVQDIFLDRTPAVGEWKLLLTDLILNGLRPRRG